MLVAYLTIAAHLDIEEIQRSYQSMLYVVLIFSQNAQVDFYIFP